MCRCVYAALSEPPDSSHYLIPVSPLRKTVFVPQAWLYLYGYLPRDESPEHTRIESLGISIFFSPSCLRSVLPGKERAGAYVNNDREVIKL